MTYSYDSHGWLTDTEIHGRTTGIEPPAHGAKIVGNPYPNWTGIEWALVNYIAPSVPTVVPPPTVRRLSKLAFVGRLGADFAAILTAAKTSVQIEMFVRQLDWATPDADGTSVDLDDARVIYALNALETAGILAAGRAQEILT